MKAVQWLRAFSQFITVDSGLALFVATILLSFLMAPKFDLFQACYLGLIIFCGWCGVDMLNNICDTEADALSHPARAEIIRTLGVWTGIIAGLFLAIAFGLGFGTQNVLVMLLIVAAFSSGVLYSIPPFRLRQTILKPIMNLSVGVILALLVASFYSCFTVATWLIVVLAGAATLSASLWDDVIDYEGDWKGGAKTMPVIIGPKKGAYLSFLSSFSLLPLLFFIGIVFNLAGFYYLSLLLVAVGMLTKLIQNRNILSTNFEQNEEAWINLMKTTFKNYDALAFMQMLVLIFAVYLRQI